jgi:NAD(P)-dependent dehydrogenase (short-subunit alcohol dehydrogenase family)
MTDASGMDLRGRGVVVIGGSRGLGLGLAGSLAARGARLTVTARKADSLAAAREQLGGAVVAADATDAEAMRRLLAEARPSLVVLAAGMPPPMERIDRISWDDYSANWSVDARAGLTLVQAALTLPLAPGSLVVLVSSGAAIAGSPLSGGYAAAKRALWFQAQYAQALSDQLGLGIAFRILVPRQMVAGTGTGDAGIRGYAAAAGRSYEAQVAQWPEMPPGNFGDMVVLAIEATGLSEGRVFGIRGDTGMVVIE